MASTASLAAKILGSPMCESAAVHVFEPSGLGHRPLFMAWLLTRPPARRRWVLHTTPAARKHPKLAALLRDPPANLTVVDLPDCPFEPTRKNGFALMRHQFGKAIAYRRAWMRHARPGDTAFIPYYDDVAVALFMAPWLSKGMPFVTLGMRAGFHRQRQGVGSAGRRVRRTEDVREFLLRRLLLRRGARFYLTNQLPLKRDVDQRWGRVAAKVRFYPDPAPTPSPLPTADARRRLGLLPEKAIVLCYGSLTERKGVDHLLTALEHADWPAHAVAVCAGAYRGAVRDQLLGHRADALVARGLLARREGFVDDATENLLFQAATAVWLVYDGHDDMSGCLVQAGIHRRPVVACANGLIGWYTSLSQGGVIYDPRQPTASLARLTAMLSDADASAAAGERLHDRFRDHTIARFRASIHAAILGSLPAHGSSGIS